MSDVTTIDPLGDNGESWYATTKLRWAARDVAEGYKLVLQQQWQGSKGTTEWRDVPTEYED